MCTLSDSIFELGYEFRTIDPLVKYYSQSAVFFKAQLHYFSDFFPFALNPLGILLVFRKHCDGEVSERL